MILYRAIFSLPSWQVCKKVDNEKSSYQCIKNQILHAELQSSLFDGARKPQKIRKGNMAWVANCTGVNLLQQHLLPGFLREESYSKSNPRINVTKEPTTKSDLIKGMRTEISN